MNRDCARYGNSLSLTAGKLVRIFVLVFFGKVDKVKDGIHAVFDFFRIFNDLLRDDRLRNNASDFPARIETCVRILENHLDFAAHELLVLAARGV